MQWKKVHFIGIGGVGMSATALLVKSTGASVSGSDEAVYPPISNVLNKEGLPYKTPYAAGNIPEDADLIVIGKNAKLTADQNPEVAAAFASGTQILSFPEVLAALSENKETLVVAGSYGKSTSTALISHILETAGKDPSYFIGAVPITPKSSAHTGAGDLFVMEGDEYPASNTDSRSKFLLMHPRHLLLTPLAHDHFNIFPTPEDYLKPFDALLSLLPAEGALVVCTEGALSGTLLSRITRPVVTYGLSRGTFQAANIVWGERTRFTVTKDGARVADIETSQLGEHNVQNIVGAAALLLGYGMISVEAFSAGVASFKGIKRRLDRKSEKTVVPIFEGFGSSYEKLRSAIAAMKLHFPSRRLLVVFEPNTIGWRSRATLSQYDDAFAGAARAYIFNPPHDGKETQLSLEDITERITNSGVPATGVSSAEDMLTALEQELQAEDAVLISSSGAMGGLTESLPALAERLFPN